MNSDAQILAIFKSELSDDQVTSETYFKLHPNWTSLISLVLITEIEENFNILLTIEQLRSANTIEDLSKFIANNKII